MNRKDKMNLGASGVAALGLILLINKRSSSPTTGGQQTGSASNGTNPGTNPTSGGGGSSDSSGSSGQMELLYSQPMSTVIGNRGFMAPQLAAGSAAQIGTPVASAEVTLSHPVQVGVTLNQASRWFVVILGAASAQDVVNFLSNYGYGTGSVGNVHTATVTQAGYIPMQQIASWAVNS